MNTLSSPSSAEGQEIPTLQTIVNGTLDAKSGSGFDVSQLAAAVQAKAKEAKTSVEVRNSVRSYADRMQQVATGQNVKKLEPNVAGLYKGPGQIEQSIDNFRVDGNDNSHIDAAVHDVDFVKKHEQTHKNHNDHLPLSVVPADEGHGSGGTSRKSDVVLRMGNVDFTRTELQEGVNLQVNGAKSAGRLNSSSEYYQHSDKVAHAMSTAGVTLGQVVTHLKAREIFKLDDSVRQKSEETNAEYQLAA